MSIVVYRDGVMAADSFILRENVVIGIGRKIGRNNKGFLIGVVGDYLLGQSFLDYAEKVGDPLRTNFDLGSAAAMVVSPKGEIWLLSGQHSCKIDVAFHALGCGDQAALAVMHMGASAEEAVEIVCRINRQCGGQIMTVTH